MRTTSADIEGDEHMFRIASDGGGGDPLRAMAEPSSGGGAEGAVRVRRILVIDDEPLIGTTLRILLDDHDVTIVTNGLDAKARFEEGESFDVILCDLMMNDMTGMDLAAWVGEHRPELDERLVFMTGGAFTDAARFFLRGVPRDRQLEKPFAADEIRRLLDRF